MPAHKLIDVSRWQVAPDSANPLDLDRVGPLGYDAVNLALTGGRGYIPGTWLEEYSARAVALGMHRSCYHWLDGQSTGAMQAAMNLNRMRRVFGGLDGFAHFADVEETGANGITPPTYAHVRDYVNAMQDALQRPVGVYSGDWYWGPRGWDGAALTPYLMAQPNNGAKTGYPGDHAAEWAAGYGGWAAMSVLQYEVAAIPAGPGGRPVTVSTSAVRDPAVWTALTTGGTPMLYDEFKGHMDRWWDETMSPGAADNPRRTALRVAPWQQRVGREPVSTHSVLFDEMRANIADTSDAVAALPEHVGAIVAEGARAVVSGLVGEGLSAEELAAVLGVALGDRAADVGAILAGGTR